MIVLLHSSKTMRVPTGIKPILQEPELITQATELNDYLKTLSLDQLKKVMHVSDTVAADTRGKIQNWNTPPFHVLPAIDSFIGDIYSGLRVHELSDKDRQHADQKLRILSGLYGVLKPLDTISPYRLEMGYRLPNESYKNLYKFWGNTIAQTLPSNEMIINASAEEYTKAVLPFIDMSRVITPRFLTMSAKDGTATFVVVHAKIARGAYAHWIIKNRISNVSDLTKFNDLGYVYNSELSTRQSPVYVCDTFGGIGLSVRLR